MKKGQKKTMTPQQIEANRNNSLKSTGPKTAEGKAAARMNAVKHGILARQAVVRGLKIKENPRELVRLHDQFLEACAPEGVLEETLVEQMVMCVWRKRRAVTAETGEIAFNVDKGWWSRNEGDVAMNWLVWIHSLDMVGEMEKTGQGVRYLKFVLEEVRDDVAKEGQITEGALNRTLDRFARKSNHITDQLAKFRGIPEEAPERRAADGLAARPGRLVLDYLDDKLRSLAWRLRRIEEYEEKEEELRRAASVLPSAEKLDKILRYETTLDRQFYRAMNQLERLQRMRRGENVPPPLTMEVSKPC